MAGIDLQKLFYGFAEIHWEESGIKNSAGERVWSE
jgi:hypothetical protein